MLQFKRQALRISGFIKADSQTFIERHLAKVVDSGRYDWDAKFARKVGYTAGSSCGRIGKYQNTGPAKQNRDVVFSYVPGKFDTRIVLHTFRDGFHISGSLRVVSSGDDQADIRHLCRETLESFDQQLEAFVGTPLSEGKNAMLGVAALGEFRGLGTST